MRGWVGKQSTGGGELEDARGGAAAPGRRTLTEDLFAGEVPAGGQSAPAGVRGKVEAATGADLGGVRVHDSAAAHEAAAGESARAFTVGQDVVLGAGAASDEHVMAHELAHTVQQRGQTSSLQAKSLSETSPGDAAEQDADRVADAALEGRSAGPVASQAVALARVPIGPTAAPAPAPPRPAPPPSTEVNRRLTQTMTAGTGAWNAPFGWDSKMHVAVDGTTGIVTTTVRLFTTAPATNRTAWESAIESRWSRRFDFIVNGLVGDRERYVIAVDVVWVDRQSDAHYTIRAIDPAHPPPGRTLGRGGTVSMTEWGTGGAQDVPHEFGHMLGNTDEYNTVNGTAHGAPNQASGNVMNNPDNLPTARHYDGVRRAASDVLFIAEGRTAVAATAGPAVPLRDQNPRPEQPMPGEDTVPVAPPGTGLG